MRFRPVSSLLLILAARLCTAEIHCCDEVTFYNPHLCPDKNTPCWESMKGCKGFSSCPLPTRESPSDGACHVADGYRAEHTSWVESEKPCEELTCANGQVTSRTIDCIPPSNNACPEGMEMRSSPGYCCTHCEPIEAGVAQEKSNEKTVPAGCEDVGICTMNWDPVCGTDGATYSNVCVLQSASCDRQTKGESPIFVAYDGECQTSPPSGCLLWFDGCNQCFIQWSDGRETDRACTKMYCDENARTAPHCMDNEEGAAENNGDGATAFDMADCLVWFDGCNECQVNEDGSMGACTLKYCDQPEEAYCLKWRPGAQALHVDDVPSQATRVRPITHHLEL